MPEKMRMEIAEDARRIFCRPRVSVLSPSTFRRLRARTAEAEPALDRRFEPCPGGAEPPRTWRPSEPCQARAWHLSESRELPNPASTLAGMAVTGSPELLIVMS